MNKGLRVGLLVAAAALSAGVIWGGATHQFDEAMTFLGLIVVCLVFERIVEVWS